MKILVTGGAGYIGSHTCVELLQEGHQIVVVDNLSNSKETSLQRVQEITGKPLTFYKADLLNEPAVQAVFEREEIEEIFELFANVGLSPFEARVITTRAEGFITARQIAEVENVKFNRVAISASHARQKLVPVLRKAAISKGYNTDGQFTPHLGHSRENKSQNKCADYYHPAGERKTRAGTSAQAGRPCCACFATM